jgi:ferredoxin--NADP+ reductase
MDFHGFSKLDFFEVTELFQILEKKKLNDAVTLMKMDAPLIAKKVQPGQFIIFRLDEFGERVPLTVADFDREAGTITLIFQVAGESTRRFSALEAGDSIQDLVGPLGVPTELPEGAKSVCVIGGGVGCAIAYPQAKHLHTQGLEVDTIVGFRSKDIVILEDEFRACSDNLYLCTDDGSYGTKGFVTNVLQEQLEKGKKYDAVIAIGPVPMMKFVCKTTEPFGVKTLVSLNPIMIDGTGMCGGCRVTVGGKIRYACVDGPDFDGHQVDFDELMRRNGTYREQEQHECRLYGKGEQ